MTINARMLIAVLFLMGLTHLQAQNQRLTWVGDEYTMRYEVIIEKETEGAYSRLLQEFTEDPFIMVSLPSGKYRCQVIPYDFLNQPVPVTDWMDFEVLPGNAKSAAGEHEIIMINYGDKTIQKEIPSTGVEPEKITEYKNRFNLYLSAVWTPFVPIYEGSAANFDESKFFGESAAISPYGVGMRLGVVSAKQRISNLGIELTASWRTYTMLFDCDMIQQFLFINDGAAINFRLGAGVSLLSSDDAWWAVGQQYTTHFNIGAALLFFTPKDFFVETGVEYSQFFAKDFFFCFLRSSIGFGYRF